MTNQPKIDRIAVYNKLDGHCAYCGDKIGFSVMQVDHIIPKRNFEWHVKNRFKVPPFLKHLTEKDVNHIDNLFPSCKTCNTWKTAFDIETFRDELEKQIKRLNNYSANYRMAKRYGLVEETDKPIVFYFEKIDFRP